MIEVKGKYGSANIRCDIVDQETISQVISILNSEISENGNVQIMPDCHKGSGCVIGTTLRINNKVCPNIVGVDIGCGMLTINLGKVEIDFKKFDEIVHTIPSGFEIFNDINNTDYKISEAIVNKLHCINNLDNKERLIKSLGSLGGGNHFIELDKDECGNIYLVIHSGSRSLGLQVCNYYQKLAINRLNDHNKEIDEIINNLKNEGKEACIEFELKKYKANIVKVIDEMAYLEGNDLLSYLDDMKLCQEFASRNRILMANTILTKYFGYSYKLSFQNNKIIASRPIVEVFETVHNYINFKDNILRKGAVSAHKGEKLIIPMNMRDGSLICIGLGNENWNYSAPHGAGRLMSRSEAKEKISLDDFKSSMDGIYSTTINSSTIDESAFAYKPMESIIENISDTVNIISVIKPIYNFKASQ